MLISTSDQERCNHPHEEGVWFDLRKLSWTQLAHAKQVQQTEALASMRAMGGELVGELRRLNADTVSDAQPDAYDRFTLLIQGIAGWSYDQPPSGDTITMLDEATVEWAYRELVRINTVDVVAIMSEGMADANGSTPIALAKRR